MKLGVTETRPPATVALTARSWPPNWYIHGPVSDGVPMIAT
jgi:hypothetical protein